MNWKGNYGTGFYRYAVKSRWGKLARQETRAMEERRAKRLEMQEEECMVKMQHEGEERQRVDWADMDVDESVDDMMTCVDLEGSVEIDDPQEEQREEQRRQDKQEEQFAEARTRGGEWSWQGGEKTENGEAEHRERQGNCGGGQGGREKEEKTEADEGRRQPMTRCRKGVRSVK